MIQKTVNKKRGVRINVTKDFKKSIKPTFFFHKNRTLHELGTLYSKDKDPCST